MGGSTDVPAERQRIDKWLWFARVKKTRSLAAKLVAEGHVRVNGQRKSMPAWAVKPGDVLTVALEHDVRLLKVVALGARRGPYPEARSLFEDLSPPPHPPAPSERTPDLGRPK